MKDTISNELYERALKSIPGGVNSPARAFKSVGRKPSFIEKAFGCIERFKSKDELLDEELDKFVSIHRPNASHISRIRDFFKAYITDSEIRDIIEDKEYNRLATNPKVTIADLKDLEEWRDVIPEYVKDYVPLNTFM